MRLKEFKDYISSFPDETQFAHSISKPFSWRGSYDEVAFDLHVYQNMSKEEILKRIELAYTELFYGYKGGEYRYCGFTRVNFEEDTSAYTDGGYVGDLIAKVEDDSAFRSQEERLIKTAFKI